MQVQILRNELPIPTDGSFTGSGQDCQAPEGTVVYVLQAINADGNAEYMQAIVEVLPAQAAAYWDASWWSANFRIEARVLSWVARRE